MSTLSPGMSGMDLDLFVRAGPVLYDPSPYPTFSVTDAAAVNMGSGTGYRVAIGHFDARNWVVPSSGTNGGWTVTWSVAGTSKTETFTVAVPTLTIVGENIGIIDQMIDNIRIDIGDFSSDIFPVSLLERYLIKSVMRLNRELGIASGRVRPTGITPGGLGTPARIPAITLDLDARTLNPNNDEIADIIVLQAEVLITQAEMSALRRASTASAGGLGASVIVAASGNAGAGSDGVMIRNADGVVIDTRQRYASWMTARTQLFLAEAKQREEELKQAIKSLKHSFSSSMGKIIY
jgi:hypothetical protein